MHPWAAVANYAPRPADLLDVGPNNVVWTALLEKIGILKDLSDPEQWRGFTGIELILVLGVASRRSWRTSETCDPGRALASLVALIVVAGILLEVKIDGRSLWALIYYFVPGGKGVRVVVRYQLVLLVSCALVSAVVVDRLLRGRGRRTRGLAVLLALALVGEQCNLTPIASLSRKDVAAAVAPIPAAPKECRSFYATHPPMQTGASAMAQKYCLHTTQAMLVAETLGLPTLNGADTFIPPGSNLFDALDDTYETRAYLYAWRHNLVAGLCSYDLTTRLWRVITAPPPVPSSNPLGSGLLPGATLSFGTGQEGLPSLDQGWSDPESFGIWATGLKSSVDVKLNASAFSADANVSFLVHSLLPQGVERKPIYVEVASAGTSPVHTTWMVGHDNAMQNICVPARLLRPHSLLRVTFRAEQSFSPYSVGINDDQRVLDFALIELVATNAACSN